MKLCPVILAGGEGTRLWPLSRKNHPKQFLRLFDDDSLLQKTLLRLRGLQSAPTLLICNEEYRFTVRDHAEAIGEAIQQIILEPLGRNTAPALTIAALAQEEDAVLLMLPADHVITDNTRFQALIMAAMPLAEEGHIVTFGMQPVSPDTGYGYIKKGAAANRHGVAGFELQEFVEKPDAATAREYCDSGEYYWNSGIFMLRAAVWLKAIEQLAPAINSCCREAWQAGEAEQPFYRLGKDAFANCPADSVDYAVMEHIDELRDVSAYVLPADVGWSDIGSWDKVWQQGESDKQNNVTSGDVVLNDTGNSLIHAESRLVTAAGCNNLAIIETADAVMVMDKGKAQQVKELVSRLQQQGREQVESSPFVHRPWGGYESIQSGPGYQVKRLLVKPGKQLSLQLHHQRSEHWVVIRGTAMVTRGEEVRELGVNESVYIGVETKHRLANEGDEDLEVIEVQVGDYLGEDDIVRFDDDFGRV
ncbi:MAG: mannose-1-phosphate guanylyltransferase/mannose-6-phosphate isomerase [Gammaproteobacteria bacterium]